MVKRVEKGEACPGGAIADGYGRVEAVLRRMGCKPSPEEAVVILSVGAIVVIWTILVYKITAYIGEVTATGALLTPKLRDVFHGVFVLAFSISVAGYVPPSTTSL